MYAAHFASALALKAKEPQAPTWGLLVGVGVLDLLFGPFVLAGIERASLTPDVSPGFSLDHIDWSHSERPPPRKVLQTRLIPKARRKSGDRLLISPRPHGGHFSETGSLSPLFPAPWRVLRSAQFPSLTISPEPVTELSICGLP